jgi:hypothetical protein
VGLGIWAVAGGELGPAEAGAAAEPVPAVPGTDHAQIVPARGRGGPGEADQVNSRPAEDEHGDGERVVPRVGEP